MSSDILVWLDLETNQLEARGGHILEVAAIITDTKLNVLDDDGFHSVIRYSPRTSDDMRNNSNEIVRDMHDENGLWERIKTDGRWLLEVESDLLDYIKKFAPETRSARLAGSSLRLDMNFLEEHMPRVYAHLHYRTIDVSAVIALCEWWGIEYTPQFNDKPHDARSDIMTSLNTLKSVKVSIQSGDQ